MRNFMDSKDVDRFYQVHGVGGACSSCGQQRWTIATGPDPVTQWALTSARSDGSAIMPAPAVPLLVLACNNCHTIRMHALIPVEKWLTDNPVSGSVK